MNSNHRDIVDPNTFYLNLPRKHLSSCVLLPYQNEYLIVKKSVTQKWSLPGGIVLDSESPDQSAIRECLEEINLAPVIKQLAHVYYSMPFESFENKRGDSIHFIFLSESLTERQIKNIKFTDGEIDDYKLIAKERFSEFISENLGKAILQSFENNIYSNLQRSISTFQEEEKIYTDIAIAGNS